MEALRDHIGMLTAIGATQRWTTALLLYQQVVVLLIGAGLGLVISVVPVAAAVWRIPGFALDLPWSQSLLLGAAVLAGCVAATLLSARRLHPE